MLNEIIHEYNLLLIILIILMLFTNLKWSKTRFLHIYWLITISMFGIMAIYESGIELFGVIIVIFNALINVSLIAEGYK